MSADYKRNGPRGWGGDPSRGAALGRATIVDVDPATFTGKLHVSRVRLDSGGYDRTGTYFGIGAPIYWVASDDGDVDYIFRALDRAVAKMVVRSRFPLARFYR